MSLSVFQGSDVLVTGASSGLGLEIALRLAPRARRLRLIARDPDRLRLAAVRVRASAGASAEVIALPVDLGSTEATGRLAASLAADPTEVLINNAASGDVGSSATIDAEVLRAMVVANVHAPVALLRAALPAMLAARRGWILNVSSILPAFPVPYRALYAATKAFLDVHSEATRAELRGSGVVLTLLRPGPMPTGFKARANRPGCPPERDAWINR